ncbi:MAG: FtsW/RodA/SpoVE family cell cycle protein [Planctomycetota bacterium]
MSPSRYTATALYAGSAGGGARRLRLATPAWIAVGAALFLSLLGISAIAVTRPELAARQGVYLAIGVGCALLATLVPPRQARVLCWFVLAVALALLVFVLLPFVPRSIVTPRNGARAWINLGASDFQPSELAKIAFIMCMSQWLALHGAPRTLRALAMPAVLFAVPVGLIVLEPDLGSALLFVPTVLAMLLAAGARMRHVLPALAAAAVLAPIAYFAVLKPYQRARIDAIVAQVKGDTRFERDIGFQGWRAMRLVGAGGAFGNDAAHAKALIVRNALPEEHNDMIFAVVGCRHGFVGGAAVLLAYALFAVSAIAVALSVRDGWSKLVAVGIGALLFGQMAVNIGMTVGLLPITGVTLPFVSYGGSSLLACWTLVGLLLGIGIRPPTGGEKDPFDG